ncbi:Gp15 family bacteriophage protein [Metabacillus sp. HB246100]
MNLTENLEDCFEYEGKVFHLDMSFDNILKLLEMLEDDLFEKEEKLFIFLEMMILNFNVLVEDLTLEECIEIMNFIHSSFIKGEEKKRSNNTVDPVKLMDFKQDSGLIYSSFLMCYNMDLYEYHGKLHWDKFRELLTGLDEKTPFMKAVGFRQMSVPTSNDVSQEYKNYVRKMKQFYALEVEEETSFNNAMRDTFNALKAIAKPKEGD